MQPEQTIKNNANLDIKLDKEHINKIESYIQSKRCEHCGVSEYFPGTKFDNKGVCNVCNKEGDQNKFEEIRKKLKRKRKVNFLA